VPTPDLNTTKNKENYPTPFIEFKDQTSGTVLLAGLGLGVAVATVLYLLVFKKIIVIK